MSWAGRRKFIYLGGMMTVFLLVVVLPTILHFYKAPTCFDIKQNGDELGVDCGGSCSLLCSAQYVPLTVKWQRFSKVSDGVYNVLAYIENPNIGAEALNLNYSFKLYDNKGILLKERTGRTFASPNKVMAVFEPELITGNQVPQRVEFSFTSPAIWLSAISAENNLAISGTELTRLETAPRLTATLTNKTVKIIKNIEAVAILYNLEGNTVAFSRTVIDGLSGREASVINFNWPKPFVEIPARTEIILRVLK